MWKRLDNDYDEPKAMPRNALVHAKNKNLSTSTSSKDNVYAWSWTSAWQDALPRDSRWLRLLRSFGVGDGESEGLGRGGEWSYS